MDILHLVDRLEELFNNSRAVPFTHQVIVDEEHMLGIIDQMRVSIPAEVKEAQQLVSQRDRMMAQAQEESSRTLNIAREKSEQYVERDSIVHAANARANQIIENAKIEADNIRRDADKYVVRSLSRLHMEVERIMVQVSNGIQVVERDISEAYEQNVNIGVSEEGSDQNEIQGSETVIKGDG